MTSRRGRFLLLFFLFLVLFEVPLLLRPVDETLVRPFTRGVARLSGAVLSAIGEKNSVAGTIIAGSCFSVNINNGCNALEVTLFLLAAVLAFPASARRRLIGAGVGILLVQTLNLTRVVALYLTGCYRREWFDTMHLAIWQTIIFSMAIFYFAQWTRRAARDVPRRA